MGTRIGSVIRSSVAMSDVAVAALAVFAFTIPIDEITTIPSVGSPARLAGLVAFLLGFVALFHGGRARLRRPALFLLVAAVLFVWNLATYLWSQDPAATLRVAFTLAQLMAAAWLVMEYCRERAKQLMVMQAFVFGNVAAFGLTVFNVLVSPSGEFRDTGPFNANQFAIILALGIPMAILLIGEARVGFVRALNVAYPLIATFGVVLAASRSGLIVCLITLVALPFALVRLDAVKRIVVLIAVLVALWFSFGYAPEVFPELYQNIARLQETSDELTTGTLTGRRTIWNAAWTVFLESPVIGVGAGAVPYALATTALGESRATHNAFLSVAGGSGLIGLALFLGLVGVSVTAAFLADARFRPYFIVLGIALIVAMMPGNNETRKDAWLVLSLLAVQRPITLSFGAALPRPSEARPTGPVNRSAERQVVEARSRPRRTP